MKLQYFLARNKSRSMDNLNTLGEREVQTLMEIIRIHNPKYSFNRKTFVDVGCGDAYLRNPVEKHSMLYNGFDIDDCDLLSDQMPLLSNSVDILVCYSVIEHLIDPSNMLNEAKRVLKKGGFLFVETPNWEYCHKTFYHDYTHVKPYTAGSLNALITDFGFDVLSLMPNVRCKSRFYNDSKFNFKVARYLPFRGFGGPFSFLKGRSTGIFCLATPS